MSGINSMSASINSEFNSVYSTTVISSKPPTELIIDPDLKKEFFKAKNLSLSSQSFRDAGIGFGVIGAEAILGSLAVSGLAATILFSAGISLAVLGGVFLLVALIEYMRSRKAEAKGEVIVTEVLAKKFTISTEKIGTQSTGEFDGLSAEEIDGQFHKYIDAETLEGLITELDEKEGVPHQETPWD